MVSMSNYTVLVTLLLPALCRGRGRRGLWDQLTLHSTTTGSTNRQFKRNSLQTVEGGIGFWEKLMNGAVKMTSIRPSFKVPVSTIAFGEMFSITSCVSA